jgi:hypothetical protein
VTIAQLFQHLNVVASAKGFTMYNICFRNAGVAVQWCDQRLLEEVGQNRYRESLRIDHYSPTLEEALESEYDRLRKLEGRKQDG